MSKGFRKASHVGLLLVFVGLVASPAVAQQMGICAGWMPNYSSYCTLATPALDIGSTSNANPVFNIGVNDGGSATAMLIVLIPQSSTTTVNSLTFTATFTQGASSNTVNAAAFGTSPYVSNQLLLQYLGLPCASNGGCNGVDYHFNSINAIQLVAGTLGYSVYALNTGLTVLGPTLTGGPQVVGVSFSSFSSGSGFPVGTIFLALGLQNGQVVYKTPLTLGMITTPEPVSLSLFGAGLIAVGAYVRHRGKRVAK